MHRTRSEKARLYLLTIAIGAAFVFLAARLVQLQILLGDEYGEIVKRQSTGRVTIPAERGAVYDRHGQVVASNVNSYSLYAYPDNLDQVRTAGKFLNGFFGLDRGVAQKKYRLKPKRFRWIKRGLSRSQASRLESSAPAGLYLRTETKRQYPFSLVGKQIVGFTDIDNRGRSGIEYSLDSILAGEAGVADIRRDGLRNTYRVQEKALVRPESGRSVVLTIDWRVQQFVEEELRRAVEKHKAKSGQACFIDCTNGQILAMAHFDPSEKNPQRPVKLRVVSDQYEPGSVFKVITAAALLDAGAINFQDSIFCELGLWKLGRRRLRDDKKLGWLNFRRTMELSSNIGMAKYAIDLGGPELLNAARQFGLGQKTGVALPGEAVGKVTAPSRWSEYNIAAFSIGHSISVSSLQMANAMAAIANGGKLYRPQLILGYVDEQGSFMAVSDADPIREAMRSSSIDSLHAILRGVVESGTAELVNSPSITIAGKTGTAQIFNKSTGRYSWRNYMASFVGFFPVENPRVAGIVVLDSPQPVHYGGHTAGPAFRRIAERYAVLNAEKFCPPRQVLRENDNSSEATVEVPDLIGRDISLASELVERRGLQVRTNLPEGKVVWQFPLADNLAMVGDEVLVVTESATDLEPVMANLKGLSMRKAVSFLRFLGVKPVVKGVGSVVSQSLPAGAEVRKNSVCRLTCRPA